MLARVLAIGVVALAAAVLMPQHAGAASTTVLRWRPSTNQKAVAYEIQIAEDADFAKVVVQERVETPGFRWKKIPDRNYYWRVRAIDKKGRFGEWSRARTIKAVLVAPALDAPVDGAEVDLGTSPVRIRMRWHALPLAGGYRVEVSRARSFSKVLFDETVEGTEARFVARQMGTYWWRVRGVGIGNADTPASAPRSFSVVLGPPELNEPADAHSTLVGEEMTFRWSSPLGAKRFRLEVARDTGFRDRLLRETTREAQFAWTPDQAGSFHWRVTAFGTGDIRASVPRTLSVGLVGPSPVAPTAGEKLEHPGDGQLPVTFAVEPQPGVGRYVIELSLADDFEEILLRCENQTSECTVPDLPVGSWRWRAVAEGTDGNRSVPSAPRALDVVAAAVDPDLKVGDPPPPQPSPPGSTVLRAGVIAAFFNNLGDVSTARLSGELVLRRAAAGQDLDLGLRVGWYTSSAEGRDDSSGLTAVSRVHVVPIELLLRWVALQAPVELAFGAGADLQIVSARVETPGQAALRERALELGGFVTASAAVPLGPGEISAVLQFGLGSTARGLVEVSPSGLLLGMGYRVGIW